MAFENHKHIEETDLSEKADKLFRFVMRYKDFTMEKRDYGTGEKVSMVEVHTLKTIADCPGITVTELAEQAHRTKGAVSQIIKRLDELGLIYRVASEEDGRIIGLHPTERGSRLNQAHVQYDSEEVSETFEDLKKYCAEEEIGAFFRGLDAYLILLSEP